MADGFLLVDKASEWTSHDVVAKCRGILGERKIGHAGTLDPACAIVRPAAFSIVASATPTSRPRCTDRARATRCPEASEGGRR